MAGGLFDEPFRMRTHQTIFQRICRERAAGIKPYRRIIAAVTPGGGKSSLPVIAAHELIGPGLAEKICWVAPRQALVEQAERDFLKEDWRRALGHTHQIRASVNDINPSRGFSGYVTTVQAVAADTAGLNAAEFARHRYILVLDECHHIHVGGEWERAIRPLVEAAWLVVYMTGSLSRHDGKPIFGLPYAGNVVNLTTTDETACLRYDRQSALYEWAVIQLHVEQLDARAEWVDREGNRQSVTSFDDADDAAGDALFTALRTDFASQLLDRALADWNHHRATANPRSKLLVVAADISSAKQYLAAIAERGYVAKIATSDDSADAAKSIRLFKDTSSRGVNILVTVAMAYEGLDVPPITHIALLTHVRSYPWIEQVLARGTRFDRDSKMPWPEQVCRAFVPDDPALREIIDKIRAEQIEALKDVRKPKGDVPGDGKDAKESAEPVGRIVPEGSELTRLRVSDLNGSEQAGYAETAAIVSAMEAVGIGGVSPLLMRKFMVHIGAAPAVTGAVRETPSAPLLTPSEREKNLKESIEKFTRLNDRTREWEWGTTNRMMHSQFGKGRGDMTLAELQAAWAWLNKTYGREATQ